jgi:hypothetical protein
VVTGVGIAIAVILADAEPTGGPLLDAFYRSLIMVATIAAAARARRRVLLVAAAVVAIGSDGWMLAPAGTALVLSFALAWTDRRDRVAGGLAGMLIAWTALNLSWPASPTGASALLAAVALVPLWFSGYRVSRRGAQEHPHRSPGRCGGHGDRRRLRAVLAATQRSTLVGAPTRQWRPLV